MNRLVRPLLAVVGLVTAGAPVHAGTLTPNWLVDVAHSRLGFAGTLAGTGFEGRFQQWQAAIAFDPAQPEQGQVEVTIVMASARTGDRQKDEALPEDDWFAVASWPEARFEAKAFHPLGGSAYQTDGTLTIRGVSRAVSLRFTLESVDGKAHASGQLPLVRTDYGVGQGAWSSPQWVAAEVTVAFDLTASLIPASPSPPPPPPPPPSSAKGP